MRVVIDTVVVGSMEQTSKKTGKPYSVVTFMDDTTPVVALYKGDIGEIELCIPCTLVVDVNLKYKDVRVSEWKKA